jgi:hypothetical protein
MRPFMVCLFRESKLLASATLAEQRVKVYLEDCESRRHFSMLTMEKVLCWLGFIPVLVFDCVALRLREGISGRFSRAQGYVFFLRAG